MPTFWGFSDSSVGKESTCNARDPGLFPGSGRSTREGTGYPLQYSWASLVAQLAKNPPALWETWARSLAWEDPLEKWKATLSSILGLPLWLSWLRIRLQCGRPRLNAWLGKIPWRSERLPTPVFWPGEFHGTVQGVAKSQTRLSDFHANISLSRTFFKHFSSMYKFVKYFWQSFELSVNVKYINTRPHFQWHIWSWQEDDDLVRFLKSSSHEIKRRLLLGRKVMTNLDSIFKSKDVTLPTKVHLVKAMVFPVFMNGCESWTVKKAERWRIDAFELWCWRRLLRVPWTARRSNQSILKESVLGVHWKDWC